MGAPKLKDMRDVDEIVEIFRQNSFLSVLPDPLVNQLAPQGRIEYLPKGLDLLTEGEDNEALFFLIEGELSILVADEVVASLTTPGDIIGEMSLIADIVSSATVRAVTDCRILSFDHGSIRNLVEVEGGQYTWAIYKVFSKVLSEKLKNTNSKARRFEIANKELKKTQKEMDEIQQKRLEELASSNRVTSGLIRDLYEKDLVSLVEELSAPETNLDPEQLKRILKQVEHTREQIRPLAEAFSTESALENKRVLLCEEDKKQQRITKMALRGTGLDMDMASSVEDALGLLENNSYDIMLVSSACLEACEVAYQKNPNMRIVVMTSDEVSTYIQYFKDHPFVTNIVSRNEEDRTFTIKNIFTTVGKLANEDIFGMSKYLAWGVDIQSLPITGSAARAGLLEQMAEQFETIGVRTGVIERCRLVAEEMLMNAIYDAPVDETGKSKYNHKQRTDTIVLEDHEQGLFSFACDGIFAAISVSDPFGALERETLIKYLESCYAGKTSSEEREFHHGKGGGGMGTHLMVETSDLIVFNIYAKKRTEVVALFNVDKKVADQLKNPSFHLFYKK